MSVQALETLEKLINRNVMDGTTNYIYCCLIRKVMEALWSTVAHDLFLSYVSTLAYDLKKQFMFFLLLSCN